MILINIQSTIQLPRQGKRKGTGLIRPAATFSPDLGGEGPCTTIAVDGIIPDRVQYDRMSLALVE